MTILWFCSNKNGAQKSYGADKESSAINAFKKWKWSTFWYTDHSKVPSDTQITPLLLKFTCANYLAPWNHLMLNSKTLTLGLYKYLNTQCLKKTNVWAEFKLTQVFYFRRRHFYPHALHPRGSDEVLLLRRNSINSPILFLFRPIQLSSALVHYNDSHALKSNLPSLHFSYPISQSELLSWTSSFWVPRSRNQDQGLHI